MNPIARILFALAIIACFTVNARAQSSPEPPTVIHNTGALGAKYPFSESVQVDHMLYLSGQIGIDSTFKVVPGGIEPETRQAMENIRAVLARNGCTLDNVIKCTVMLADMKEWPAFNAIYKQYFKVGLLPARSALGCNGLALGARVEIECIAVK